MNRVFADISANKDEMDDYIEEQLDNKKKADPVL
jgi:hypothetical protein